MRRVVIVGGGIAGLSIAWAIRRTDPSAAVVLLEGGAETGGNIRTEVVDGYRCEWGPDGFLDNAPATLQLVRELGMEARLQQSSDAARRRFIFRRGRLHEVPTSPLKFLGSGLLSLPGKLRLMGEPFGRRPPGSDESIHAFAARRIGEEAASVLVDSMVSGVFAGDAHALSLRACFPKMFELERDHGSLVRAMIATRKRRTKDDAAGAPAGRLMSFIDGMAELPAALTRALGTVVRTSAPATSLRRTSAGTWQVATADGIFDADAVVLAGPASTSARLVEGFDAMLSKTLNDVPSAPLAVVALGYDAMAAGPLPGFGFLVPRSEGVRILGALWETSIYANRAPAGKALLRVMIGGARDREAVALSDDALVHTVRADLERTMGLHAVPEFVKIVRHKRGIPQYAIGHVDRLKRIDDLLSAHQGLLLAGNSYRGVSINSCIAEAGAIAEAALEDVGAPALRRAG